MMAVLKMARCSPILSSLSLGASYRLMLSSRLPHRRRRWCRVARSCTSCALSLIGSRSAARWRPLPRARTGVCACPNRGPSFTWLIWRPFAALPPTLREVVAGHEVRARRSGKSLVAVRLSLCSSHLPCSVYTRPTALCYCRALLQVPGCCPFREGQLCWCAPHCPPCKRSLNGWPTACRPPSGRVCSHDIWDVD